MLCLKSETLEHDIYTSQSVVTPMNLGSFIHRYLQKGRRISNQSSSSSANSYVLEDIKTGHGAKGSERDGKMCLYRSQLEKDVQKLQIQLQEEIDLHVALARAVAHTTSPLSNSSCQLPNKAQELLANIAVLEIAVLKLEEELFALHFQLSQERNERRLAEYRLRHSVSPSPSGSASPLPYSPSYSRELPDLSIGCGHLQTVAISRQFNTFSAEKNLGPCDGGKPETMMDDFPVQSVELESSNKGFLVNDLWHHPNQLSEEMVRCMRNIFLCLADSSKLSSSDCIPSPVSPHGHLSSSSLASFSDSSIMPSFSHSPLIEQHICEVIGAKNTFDPYRVQGKLNWTNIGRYSVAADVTWMSVGKEQLEYAAVALKSFRLLVEQLAKINPACMSCNERLAFWINLYNALIMHAYLAYGIPRSDIKLFSLMQKVAYTVGGHSFSAVDIEYIILKMKPPVHRPQIALVLALHKFKNSEELRKYSIDSPEPLLTFALSCGMYSSPAVRIFTADKVIEELHDSMRDYIQASVGINNKGKLLVPKPLHCFAKGIVEDSLLADWICRFLSPEQAAMVRDSTSQQKQRLLSARSFVIVPFDSRFRYLFLPENESWSST
ncbi:uncharacterized protein LOC143881577 [Tasmannia lanceolata]|uniref:uncharacterized protein LOC143881577 n=1 Tax=Tasmannia lanceolata TaxID=3420 RepID=UPI004063AAEF